MIILQAVLSDSHSTWGNAKDNKYLASMWLQDSEGFAAQPFQKPQATCSEVWGIWGQFLQSILGLTASDAGASAPQSPNVPKPCSQGVASEPMQHIR